MRKIAKRDIYETRFAPGEFHQVVANVENYKRRRSLPHLEENVEFFDRLLSMKKMTDFVFITKTAARTR
jgi:hypothetical protein